MDTIENLIPDLQGNHLVVVLSFYDSIQKETALQIPQEFFEIDVADISIEKLNSRDPLHFSALYSMCRWLITQFNMYPNAAFTFICSIDDLDTNHIGISPAEYRWELFKRLCQRYSNEILADDIQIKDIVVGPDGFQSYARIFYRRKHETIIQHVSQYLTSKYPH